MKNNKIRSMALAAMMGAVAFVLMLFRLNIPFLSPFADLDASALPEIIGGFILGPVGAIEIIVIKLVLKIAFQGTSSMFTGELQNLLLSIAYVLPAIIYYRKHRTKQGALIGLIIGTVTCIITSIFTNMLIIFPFYISLYGMSWDDILQMCAAVNPWVKSIPTMILFSVIPLNLVSRTIASLLAMLLYKKISVPLKRFIQ